MIRTISFSALLFLCSAAVPSVGAVAPATTAATPAAKDAPTSPALSMKFAKLAADYSSQSDGFATLIMVDGKIFFEAYSNGKDENSANELASGTKSFWGIAAIAAQEDHLLSLDEKVSDTITEWKTEPAKEGVTIRQLLTLTSGLQGGAMGKPPTYDEAIKTRSASPVGTEFHYGPAPFQVFGELLRRKLTASGQSPVDYLTGRILTPIGLNVADWRKGADGNPIMPSGAKLSAREWAKFGELIRNHGMANGEQIVTPEDLAECFKGTKVNPHYGLTFWLNSSDPEESLQALVSGKNLESVPWSKVVPADAIMAAGLGKQRLYVIPSLKLVAVRQGKLAGKGFRDEDFLSLLLTGKSVSPPRAFVASADAPTTRTAPLSDKPGPAFLGHDKNGDGKLSADEIPERVKGMMATLDKNNDGEISWDEWKILRNNPNALSNNAQGQPQGQGQRLQMMKGKGGARRGGQQQPPGAPAATP